MLVVLVAVLLVVVVIVVVAIVVVVRMMIAFAIHNSTHPRNHLGNCKRVCVGRSSKLEIRRGLLLAQECN